MDGVALGSDGDDGGIRSLPGWVMNIPLSKSLPTKHFAVLGEGVVHGRRWAVFAFNNGRTGGKQRPCIQNVILRYEHKVIAISTGEPSCGPLTPPRTVPVSSEYVFTNVSGMVVGMTLDPSVAQVKLELSSGMALERKTRLLTSQQAAKAKVKPFRYVAMGISRKACLESVEGISSSGATLFQTPQQECVI